MSDEERETEDVPGGAAGGAGVLRPVLLGTGVALLLALAGLWIQRAPIAENLIGRELAARDVRMRYDIASIGPRTQRIENVVLGDPASPDLTARWVEVDIGVAGLVPTIANVRAGGVRLRGTLRDGTLSFGEVDKFLGEGERAETVLPDIGLGLEDARLSLATDHGALGVVLSGNGNLHDGFSGRAVAAMPELRIAGCGAKMVRADLAIVVEDGAPRLRGPVEAATLGCPDRQIALAAPRADIAGRLSETLRFSEGRADFAAKAVRAAGFTVAKPAGRIAARGDAGAITGTGELSAEAMAGAGLKAGRSRIDGRFVVGERVGLNGRAALADLDLSRVDGVRALRSATAGTPVGPLATKLAEAITRASRDNRLGAAFTVESGGGAGTVQVSDLNFVARSGARLTLPAGSRFALRWPQGGWAMDGVATMAGGGLPDAALRLASDARGGLTGRLVLEPYATGTARMAATPVLFSAGPGGSSQVTTTLALDGPLADGFVRGLSFPVAATIAGNGTVMVNERCARLGWRALAVADLRLDPAAMTLCPRGTALLRIGGGRTEGGARTGALTLAGRIGSSPLALRAGEAEIGLAGPDFRIGGLDVRIGGGENPVILRAARLQGEASGSGLSGSFAGGSARIGAVPLDLSEMAGRWRLAGGRLDVDGGLRVADVERDARFNPMLSRDATLSLANGRITAAGHLRHPARGPDVARVDIVHDLSTGAGNARLVADGLRFGPGLQPDDLTPVALGVVANVEGTVDGAGEIVWTETGVTSSGRFSTAGMNLAAAFGPVQGLTTTLNFTDLLALETAPDQVATVASINPGIEVLDGRIVFQLLRDQRARIEGGQWPFSGGTLTLLPTVLDFDAKRARNLTFRVEGMSAGAFINTLDLDNISATGTYDGLLPMVFDANGGRIVGGILVARQQGMPPLIVRDAQALTMPCDPRRQAGTLSYVGDVSNADMGMFGKLAFDALKNLRYRCLTILLDGAIDGEFVTQIAVNGVNQGSGEAMQSALLKPFLGLPFIFNVRIEAPFRGLLNTYQSFGDPTTVIRNSLGAQYQSVLKSGLAVQPPDSEKAASREGE